MSASKNIMTIHQEVTCPFCSLLCDDLVIQNDSGHIKVKENGCAKAIAQYEQPPVNRQPLIKGKQVSIDDAITHAGKLIRQAKQP
jgi:formylmethanofuran dehydrogenase subunit B